MWAFISNVFLIWCVWRIWTWLRARRMLKRLEKEEAEKKRQEEERSAEFWRQHKLEHEERQRRYQELLEEKRRERERWEAERPAREAAEKERAAEREKAEIASKLKERQRRRELEKQVRLELIDSGELFGDEAKRPPIPRDVVDAVYRRDGARCVYCGSTENLQLDHIIPFSKGGATSLENLQLLCQKCNLEKSNKIG